MYRAQGLKMLRQSLPVLEGEHKTWDSWARATLLGRRVPALASPIVPQCRGFEDGLCVVLGISDCDIASIGSRSNLRRLDPRFVRARARTELAQALTTKTKKRSVVAGMIEAAKSLIRYARALR